MPKYRITSPDGRTFEVTAPEGATQDEVLAYAQQNYGQAQSAPLQEQGADPQLAAAAANIDVSGLGRGLRGIMDVPQATTQMALSLPKSVQEGLKSLGRYGGVIPGLGGVAAAAQLLPDQSAKDYTNQLAQQEQAYSAARKAAGQEGVDWARLGGNMLASLPASLVLPSGGAGLLGKTGAGMVQGGVLGTSQPVYNGDNIAAEKAKQAGIGAAVGGLLSPVVAAAGRVISPKVSAAVKGLLGEGITPTPGQILGGIPARMEEKLTSIPFTGELIRSGQQRAANDLNRAAIDRSLAPIGESLPKGLLGRDAISYAGNRLSQAYDDVLNKVGAVPVDQQFGQSLTSLSGLTKNLPKDIGEQFDRILKNEIVDRVDANGIMTSEGLKAAESNLGQVAKAYLRNADYDKRQLGSAILEAQSSLRQMLERQAPQYAAELKAVNAGWANLLRPQQAAASLGAEDGIFSAAQLQNAVKALDPSKNKRAFARGDALMQDLSDPAKSVLGSKVPDSGTAGRLMSAGPIGLLSALATSPLGLIYSPMGQRAVAGLLTQRPAIAQPIAGLLEQSAPTIGAAGAISAPQLLYQ